MISKAGLAGSSRRAGLLTPFDGAWSSDKLIDHNSTTCLGGFLVVVWSLSESDSFKYVSPKATKNGLANATVRADKRQIWIWSCRSRLVKLSMVWHDSCWSSKMYNFSFLQFLLHLRNWWNQSLQCRTSTRNGIKDCEKDQNTKQTTLLKSEKSISDLPKDESEFQGMIRLRLSWTLQEMSRDRVYDERRSRKNVGFFLINSTSL